MKYRQGNARGSLKGSMQSAVPFLLLLAACSMAAWTGTAQAAWQLDVESKQVETGATGVNVKVTGYWDLGVTGITLPIIVRELDAGSFWTGTLPYDTGGVPGSHPYAVGVTWDWVQPWAFLVEEFRSGVPTGDCPTDGDTGYDGVAPDHFVINAAGISAHPAEPTGRDFLTFTFDVTGDAGSFEFDTACFSSQLPTIFLIDGEFPPVDHGPLGADETVFNKGTVVILAGPCPDVIGDYTNAVVSGTELDNLSNTHDGNYNHPNGTAAAFYLQSGPGAVEVNTGEWTWTPGAGDDGTYTVVVEVSDVVNGEGGCPANTLEFTVEVAAIPVGVSCGGPISGVWGVEFQQSITVSTPFDVTYDVISGPGAIEANGLWTWTPTCGDIAGNPHTVTIEATDIANRSEQCSFDATVTNVPPSGTVPNTSFFYTNPYAITLTDYINDDDGHAVTFSNLTITPTPPENLPVLTGPDITWTPSLADAQNNNGNYHFTVDGSDGCETVTFEWEVIVTTVQDKVEIGSTNAQALMPGVELPIRVVASTPMWTISIPLQARSVSGGAFWAGEIDTLPWQMLPEDAVSHTRRFDKYPNFDRTSPDDFLLWAKAFFGNNHCLWTPDTAAYITLRFDLNNNPGQFEIDTVALAPSYTLYFALCDEIATIKPAFVKGVVTINPCDCNNGDVNCDGKIDPVDFVYLVNFIYLNRGEPCNPGNCFQNGDINCDHSIDPLDAAYFANYVFRDRLPPCDPCTEW